MSARDVLEVVAIFGSIVGVWFALVGWKLVSSVRAQRHPGTSGAIADGR